MAEIGKHIRKIRKEKNLTQEELAERLHCTRQTISNYENGKSEPDIAHLIEIAGALEVEINDLIYGPGKREGEKRQRDRAVAALTAAGVLMVAVKLLLPFAQEKSFKYFQVAPLFLLQYVLWPFALILLGWGMAEAGKAFAGICIWKGRTERTKRMIGVLFYASAAIVAVFAVLALWTAVDLTYLWWMTERLRRSGQNFDFSTVPGLMPKRLQSIFIKVIVLHRLGGAGLFLGAASGLCRIKKEESGGKHGRREKGRCNESGSGRNGNDGNDERL